MSLKTLATWAKARAREPSSWLGAATATMATTALGMADDVADVLSGVGIRASHVRLAATLLLSTGIGSIAATTTPSEVAKDAPQSTDGVK